MWQLDHKEGWVPKNWCLWIVVLGKILEDPLYSKENKPVNAKRNQSWIFIGRTNAEVEVPIPWPPEVKSLLIGKDPDTGKEWRQKEKRAAGLDSIADSMDMNLNKLWEAVKDRGAWWAASQEVEKSWTQLSNWTISSLSHHISKGVATYILIDEGVLKNFWVPLHIYKIRILESYACEHAL